MSTPTTRPEVSTRLFPRVPLPPSSEPKVDCYGEISVGLVYVSNSGVAVDLFSIHLDNQCLLTYTTCVTDFWDNTRTELVDDQIRSLSRTDN